ncbi:hypothetical protein MI467_03310 [Delftia acidovorans]|uniref:DUF6932 family protein n=1 Tax=Delftia acidovorans TaxID=80866 RepID=UPI001EFEA8A3|nr:hypothetical protein [Delftia acidovorans]MCG8985865.1 hypothetical protein [Delftia acidovorans]
MAIPEFDQYGMLPVGQHDCSLQEIEERFCWNPHRQMLFDGLKSFLALRWGPLKIDADLWVDGSFTRRKEMPNDIDVVVDISHIPVDKTMPAVLLHLQNTSNKQNFYVDFWLKHPQLAENDLVGFFQYTGLKAGAELNLDSKKPKGILRVSP